MKNSLKHVLSFLTVMVFIFFAIASAVTKEGMTVARGQIPPEFNGYNGTLLIIKQSKNWNKYAMKHFTENYKGKFIMIGESEIDNYSNNLDYRFMLTRSLFHSREIGVSGKSEPSTSESLCTVDRKTEARYCTLQSSNFGKLLKAYSAALEDERVKEY